jgi:uncharacterized membrane protein YgaE (UPF0421/DUF939 family)
MLTMMQPDTSVSWIELVLFCVGVGLTILVATVMLTFFIRAQRREQRDRDAP